MIQVKKEADALVTVIGDKKLYILLSEEVAVITTQKAKKASIWYEREETLGETPP